jgi:5S rRNA maturation endonuclease (ribonuclease M5)
LDTIDKRERASQKFGEFLGRFVTDLNNLAAEGWSILVEGPRDAGALRKLGFVGNLVTISSLVKAGNSVFQGDKKVAILTDLDREGAVLAARYIKRLNHDGLRTSLKERMRLKNASHGVYLHVENLSRFAKEEA